MTARASLSFENYIQCHAREPSARPAHPMQAGRKAALAEQIVRLASIVALGRTSFSPTEAQRPAGALAIYRQVASKSRVTMQRCRSSTANDQDIRVRGVVRVIVHRTSDSQSDPRRWRDTEGQNAMPENAFRLTMVREVGVEPTSLLGRWILSPLRLPIPPLPQPEAGGC